MRKAAVIGLAVAALAAAGCQTTPVQDGAVVGGALGAGLGAIIGHQTGHQGEGALIGAGAGALAGALVGDQVGQQNRAPRHQQTASGYRPAPTAQGHWETRLVRGISGELYEERVWVPRY